MKRILSSVMILSLLFLLASCGANPSSDSKKAQPEPAGDNDKVITLKFSTHLPETAIDGASLRYYLEEVAKETGNKVKFEYYFSQSLVKTPDSLNAVSTGLTDIQFIPEGFFATQFMPMFVAMQPYVTRSEWVANKALYDMLQDYAPFKEMCDRQNVVNLGTVVPSEVVIVSKTPIKTLDDLKGKKIRAMGAINQEMTLLGATPVAMDVSEVYESLERGTIDAATGIPSTLAVSLKFHEVAKYFTFTGRGIYNTSSLYMNKDVYESLPDDIKEAFHKVFERFIDEYSGEQFMASALKETVQAVKDAGGEVIALTEEEQAEWAKSLAPMEQEFIKSATGNTYNGEEILKTYKDLVVKYTPEDKSYKPY